jgi:hypothetical protein
MNNVQTKAVQQLAQRKKVSRDYLRSLTPLEKIAKLVDLQEQYYQMLLVREQNGGRPIPEKWKKWRIARP